MTNALLQAEGICKRYGDNEVLTNLDLTLFPGKIYGLIGRNGVGKTTLLGILTGQNTMDAGSVTYEGQEVWENQAALEQICFARELQPTLGMGPNNLKVKHYLRSGAIFYPNWDQPYADKLLAEFKLDPKKKIAQLSKGQMSMLTILLALASRAPLTILDEPVAGLDVVMRDRFYQLLLEDFSTTNRTFVVSTHILEEAAGVFDQVLILDRGRMIENAPTDALLEQFRTVSGLAEAVDRACMGVEVLSSQTMGRRKTCTVRSSPVKLAALERENPELDVAGMNLQHVFIALCGHGDV